MPATHLLAAAALLIALPAGAAALKPLDVAGFHVEPNEAGTLRWRVEGETPAGPLRYELKDYAGSPAGAGEMKVGDGSAEAVVRLSQGYYDLEVPATKQRFGVLSLPAWEDKPGGFFCIDSAMSWLVREDSVREGLIKVLRRSGIAMSRERLGWGAVQPAADKWDWQAQGRYDGLRQTCARHRVALLEMFHDAPAWMGRVGKYPDDLVAAARAWEAIAGKWHATWGALEVWNEPDIFFGANLPADQYVPVVKAVAYALHRAKVDTPLIGPVVAHYNRPWLDSAARNGLLDLVGAVSFHTYGRAEQMEALVGQYRDWLAFHGRGGMPLWITECGRPWKKGPPRPPADQDAASALDITMKAVEALACGVRAYFAFVYPYYEENANNFGMMGRAGTPLRSFAAYANLVRVLEYKRYIGDLTCEDRAVRRARVFRAHGETVAVLYTGRVDAKATVRVGLKPERIEGIDGRVLTPAPDGAIPVPDGLTILWLPRGPVKGLRPDTQAMRLFDKAGEATGGPRRGSIFAEEFPVVLRSQFDAGIVDARSEGYRLKGPAPEKFPLVVRAFNLSARPLRLRLEAKATPNTVRVAAPAGQDANVPAAGHVDVRWEIDLRGAFAAGNHVEVTVRAQGAGAGVADVLVMDFSGEATLEQMLKAFPGRTRLPIEQTKRWAPNITGDGTMTVAATPEGHWRLDAQFAKGDPWVYPFFALPEDVTLAGAKGLLIRARCLQPAAVRVFCWEGEKGVGYLTPGEVVPADGQWHAALVRFGDLVPSGANAPDPDGRLDLAKVRRISIGLNSKARRNTLEVSDLYVLGGK